MCLHDCVSHNRRSPVLKRTCQGPYHQPFASASLLVTSGQGPAFIKRQSCQTLALSCLELLGHHSLLYCTFHTSGKIPFQRKNGSVLKKHLFEETATVFL